MIHLLVGHPITLSAVAIFAVALWKGGGAERWGAALMISDWALELVATDKYSSFVGATPAVFCDVYFACGLLVISLCFGRLWLGVAMVLQSVSLALHALSLSPDAPTYGLYASTLNGITILLLLSLLTGATSAWTRRVRRRSDPSPAAQPLAHAV